MRSVPADDFVDNYFDVVQELKTSILWAGKFNFMRSLALAYTPIQPI